MGEIGRERNESADMCLTFTRWTMALEQRGNGAREEARYLFILLREWGV